MRNKGSTDDHSYFERWNFQFSKIRKPDPTRPERGDADFNLDDYEKFKNKYVGKEGFSLIERKDHEMVELMEKGSDVRVYFSHPHIDKLLLRGKADG